MRLYSGAFVDVTFDYFLANDTSIKSDKEWRDFSCHVYEVLDKYEEILPESFRKILPRMQKTIGSTITASIGAWNIASLM